MAAPPNGAKPYEPPHIERALTPEDWSATLSTRVSPDRLDAPRAARPPHTLARLYG